jgi:hypothetical protein
MSIKKLFLLLLLISTQQLYAQQRAVVFGVIKDEEGKGFSLVTVSVKGTVIATKTDELGYYELRVPADSNITISFAYIGYQSQFVNVKLKTNERFRVDKKFAQRALDIREVIVQSDEERTSTITKIDPKILSSLPSASGNFEAILKTLPGVNSNNEMSSQYNVRGGNFDENLVYVNDVEIYRPFLVRSGQQEGLSFINADMVSSVKFSAGGFESRYGDKLSSVLDIKYKKPKDFAGTASVGLLGTNVSFEGTNKNRRLSYLVGFRQKSTKYLLGTLDVDGDYQPSFYDLQSYISYDINTDWELSFLGNLNSNKYTVIPQSRETTYGTFNEVLRLTVYFQGQEVDQYQSGMGAVTATYHPNNDLNMKFIASRFQTDERETFDIEGQYLFDEIESNFGKSNFGQVKANRGVGGFLNHARNFLFASVQSFEHKGSYQHNDRLWNWGVKYQHEVIEDRLSEWKLIDSADYAAPDIDNTIVLQDVVKAKINLSSNRVNGFLQHTLPLSKSNDLKLVIGARAMYWDYTKELNVSPRATISYKPNWEKDWVFRASWGYYQQAPFYRELRNYDGTLSINPKTQQSIHYVLAADHQFLMFGKRKFRFISELYYKNMKNIIPYEVDNVRIRYYANDKADAYSMGADFKVNGEFVKDLESWFSLSFLKTEENIKNDSYAIQNAAGVDSATVYPGYIPRPTDQRFNFSIFFQDKLTKDPSVKVHLNVVFGSRLPFGPPDFARYKDTLRMPPYWRADIGFSKEWVGLKSGGEAKIGPFKSIMLYAEVFNLFKRSNTISYLWIRDVRDQQYAIPNYLTSRQLNVRLVAKF